MKKGLKKIVAMVALFALLMQNSFTAFAAMEGSEPVTEQPEITVEHEEAPVNENFEEGTETEYVDGDLDVTEEEPTSDVNYDDEAMPLDEGITEEPLLDEVGEIVEVDEAVDERLEILENQISGSGLDSVDVYVDTEGLNNKDTFRIAFTGPDSASYDAIINETLDKASAGTYSFRNLNKEGFNIRVTSQSNINVIYTSENGTPVIKVSSIDKEAEKKLDTKVFTANNGSPVTALVGEGYDSIKINVDSLNLPEDVKYTLYVDTNADATVNGSSVKSGINNLGKEVTDITVDNLEGKEFTAYVISESEGEIANVVSINSVDDGIVTFTLEAQDIRTKRVYEYSDSRVSVRATLQYPEAVPDDAEFVVTEVTSQSSDYNYSAYMKALNDNAEKISDDNETYDESNTLLYDVAFFVTDEDGNRVEYQPEVGAVSVAITFKNNQLEEKADTVDGDDESRATVVHMPLNSYVKENVESTAEATNITADDIKVEVVAENVMPSAERADFELTDFSVVAIINNKNVEVKTGTNRSYLDILGSAVNYGITANSIHFDGHCDANFATGYLSSNANNTTQGEYTGSHNPGNDIIADFAGGNWYANANGERPYCIFTTPDVAKILRANEQISKRPITIDDSHTREELQSKVSGYVSGTLSSALANEADYNRFSDIAQKSNNAADPAYTINIKDGEFPAGTYYINFAPGEYNTNTFNNSGKLNINLRDDQLIVFNVPDSDVTISSFMVNGQQSSLSDKKADWYTKHIVWNVPAQNANVKLDGVFGMFLVPNGNVEIGTTSTGWLVCNNMTGNAGEWHGVWQEMPSSEMSPTEIQFNVEKTLSNVNAGESTDDARFTFELYKTDGRFFTDNGASGDPLDTIVIDNYSNYKGTKSFKSIPLNEKGTHYFVIKEIIEDENVWKPADGLHFTYIKVVVDEETKTVNNDTYKRYFIQDVSYSRNQNTGFTSLGNGGIQTIPFENVKVSTEPKADPAKVSFKAKKVFKDNVWPTNGSATLVLEACTKNDAAVTRFGNWVSGTAPMPADSNGNVKRITVNNSNEIDFGEISFPFATPDGEDENDSKVDHGIKCRCYMYKMYEEIPDAAKYDSNSGKWVYNGVSYDPVIRTLKVWVNQLTDGNGNYRVACDVNVLDYDRDSRDKTADCNNATPRKDKCDPYNNPSVFTNAYAAKGEGFVSATKLLEGRELTDNEFEVELTAITNGAPLPAETKVKNKGINFNFGKITFTKTGEYNYQLKETKGNDEKIKYAEEPITVTFNVTDNGNGGLNVVGPKYTQNGKDVKAEFKNTYDDSVSVHFIANKRLDGSNLTENDKYKNFTFTIKSEDDSEFAESKNISGTTFKDGNGNSVEFPVREYKVADIGKTYHYVIAESKGNQNDVSYSTVVHNVAVKIGYDENSATKKMKAYVSVDGKETGNNNASVTFDNYTRGTAELKVKKVFEGKSVEGYKFKVTDPINNNSAVITTGSNGYATYSIDKKFTVEDLGGQAEKQYVFKVQEQLPDGITTSTEGVEEKPNGFVKYKGVVYDLNTYNYVVVLSKNGNAPQIKYYKDTNKSAEITDALEITNTYEVSGKPKQHVEAVKTFNGKTLKAEDGTYYFTVKDANGNKKTVAAADGGKVVFDDFEYDAEGKYVYTIYESDESGNELSNNTSNAVKYDLAKWTAEIEVKDVDGELKASNPKYSKDGVLTNENKASFNNESYKGEAKIVVKKDLKGKDGKDLNGRTLTQGEFAFKLYAADDDGNKVGDALATKSIDSKGEVIFENIDALKYNGYSNAVKHFVIEETEEGLGNGITAKKVSQNVTVSYVYNDAKNAFVPTVIYEDGKEFAEFINYLNADTFVKFGGKKTLLGGKLTANTYSIGLYDVYPDDDVILQSEHVISTADVDAKGNYSFSGEGENGIPKLKYTEADAGKEYTYWLREVTPENAVKNKKDNRYIDENGIEYDSKIAKVTVKVAFDPSSKNGIKATATVSTGEDKDNINFINKNTSKIGTDIQATKVLVNSNDETISLDGRKFNFYLLDENHKELTHKQNDESGIVSFTNQDVKELNYNIDSLDGATSKDFTYYLVEEHWDEKGYKDEKTNITFDSTQYRVVVTVRCDENGALVVEQPKYYRDGDTVDKVTFTNKYEAKGSLDLEIEKTFEGRPLTANDSVSFTIKEIGSDSFGESKTLTIPATLNGNKYVFEKKTFPGVFEYTENDLVNGEAEKNYILYENPMGDGIIGGGETYVITVKLSDNKAGVINVDKYVRDTTKEAIKVSLFDKVKAALKTLGNKLTGDYTFKFKNTYEASGKIQFSAQKIMEAVPYNNVINNKEFKFILNGDGLKNDENFVTATRDDNGAWSVENFDEIEYTADDAGKTFTYTITEEKPKDSNDGITYSNVTYTYKVTVTDGGNGNLNIDVKDENGNEVEASNDNGTVKPVTATFENTYGSTTSLVFGGDKISEHFIESANNEYTFKLTSKDNKIRNNDLEEIGNELTSPVTVIGNQVITYSFDEIFYTSEDYGKEYHYTISEVNGGNPKIQYSEDLYEIVVRLSYDDNGLLKATAYLEKDGSEVELKNEELKGKFVFKNIYAEPNTLLMEVTKTVNGNEPGTLFNKFTFSCVEVDENGKPVSGGYSELKKGLDNTGRVSFRPSKEFTINDVGTYYYKITEDTPTSPIENMAYDKSEYIVKAEVKANDGKVSIEKTYTKTNGTETTNPNSITFDNKYDATGEVTISGTKTLASRSLKSEPAEKYSAAMYESLEAATAQSGAVKTAVVNNETGEFKFEPFKYSVDAAEGSKKVDIGGTVNEKYYVRENVPSDLSTVTYDSVIYEVTWTVTDKKNGELEITKPVYKVVEASNTDNKKTSGETFDKAELKNCYKATGTFDPIGFKKMIGRNLEDGEFDFQMEYVSFTGEDGKEVKKGNVQKVQNTGNVVRFNHKNVPFLNYELSEDKNDIGLHKYIISEIEGKLPGVDYSNDKYEIWVNVSDNGDGTLNVEVDENSPSKWSKYRLDESTGILENLVADSDPDKIDIEIDGYVTDMFLFGFVNTYTSNGYLDISGTKMLEGRTLGDNDKYVFEMTRADMPGVTKKTINSGNVVAFTHDDSNKNDILNFTKEGEYEYIIKEEPSNDASVKGSTEIWKVLVNVSEERDRNGKLTGKLIPVITGVESKEREELAVWKTEAVPSMTGNNSYSYNNVFSFTNKYDADVKIKLNGIKRVKTSKDTTDYVTDGTMLAGHRFALLDSNNNKIDDVISKTDGSYEFKALAFNSLNDLKAEDGISYIDSKTYNYKVVEWNPVTGTSHVMNPGQTVVYGDTTYDTSVHDVEVTVSATGSSELAVAVKVDGKNVAGSVKDGTYTFKGAEFTNILNRTTKISGNKIWDDNVKDPASRPDVEIFLYANGRQVDKYTIKAPATKYTFENLPALDSNGKEIVYTVEEGKVPGYSSTKSGFDFYNTAGDIKIAKIDATTGEGLSGAVLAIYDGTKELERWTSTYGYHVVTAALKGGSSYTLKEISAPTGYLVAADKKFTVPADGKEISVTMEDKKIVGGVRLTKRDASTRETLSGAEFALYRENGTRVYATGTAGSYKYTSSTSNGVFLVNSSGALEITELPYGTYYFTELKAPTGYSISSERLSFSVLSDGTMASVTCLDKKLLGAVRLRKISSTGTRSLAGAVFELYAKTPSSASSAIASTIYRDAYYRVGRYTTDASGGIYVGDLPWDDYYFIEVKAPDGYTINTDVNGDPLVYTFTIGGSGTTDMVYDLGSISNSVVPTTPPTTPPSTPPSTPPTTPSITPSTTPRDEGVAGVKRGGVLSGVLGVRAAPKQGVLGERVGPATGDTANIILWMLLLLVSVGAIIGVGIAGRKKKRA